MDGQPHGDEQGTDVGAGGDGGHSRRVIVAELPFPVRGIDSDNGSEFINAHTCSLTARRTRIPSPDPARQEKRRRARRAEELGSRAPGRRLLRL